MNTGWMALQVVLGSAAAALNLVYWWMVAKRWHERFRLYCERKFGVRIGFGMKGHWQVAGKGPWIRRFAIEWLQLAYFLGAFVVWAAALLLVLLVLTLLEKAGSPAGPRR